MILGQYDLRFQEEEGQQTWQLQHFLSTVSRNLCSYSSSDTVASERSMEAMTTSCTGFRSQCTARACERARVRLHSSPIGNRQSSTGTCLKGVTLHLFHMIHGAAAWGRRSVGGTWIRLMSDCTLRMAATKLPTLHTERIQVVQPGPHSEPRTKGWFPKCLSWFNLRSSKRFATTTKVFEQVSRCLVCGREKWIELLHFSPNWLLLNTSWLVHANKWPRSWTETGSCFNHLLFTSCFILKLLPSLSGLAFFFLIHVSTPAWLVFHLVSVFVVRLDSVLLVLHIKVKRLVTEFLYSVFNGCFKIIH